VFFRDIKHMLPGLNALPEKPELEPIGERKARFYDATPECP
jgi:hypothetical protein